MGYLDLEITEFEKAILQIDRVKAAEIFERCYFDKNQFEQLEHIAIHSLGKIGKGWENGSISLSQVYMSGIICEELIDRYMPRLKLTRKNSPKMAICVLQDHHALGKRIVCSIIRANAFEVMDFGQGLSVERVVDLTIQNDIELLLISALMLPSALKVRQVKDNLRARGSSAKIIVGGAPFRLDPDLWETVGADIDGKNATNIIEILEFMTKGVEVV